MSKIKQAVILAAGRSSRFWPLAVDKQKSSIHLLGKSIVQRTVESLKDVGVEEIIIVHSPNKKPNIEVIPQIVIKYVAQTEPKGMGNALLQAKKDLGSNFIVIFPYHFDCKKVLSQMIEKHSNGDGVMLLQKPRVAKRGLAFVEGDKLVKFEEKPYSDQKDAYSIAGMYILTDKYLEVLEKQPDDHYNFELALDDYFKKHQVIAHFSNHKLLTFKYPWHLFDFKDYIFKSDFEGKVSSKAEIDKTAIIKGDVIIENGAKIGAYVIINGPAYIGKNAFVGDHSLIRNKSVIEDSVVVGAYAEVKNSIIFQGAKVNGFIADSIIGEKTQLAHGVITANRRLDKKNIVVGVKGKKVDTNLGYFGVIIGNDSSLGIKVGTMPGVLIGSNSVVGPGEIVYKNIPSDTIFYKGNYKKRN